jgi:hypothetical protein
VASLSRRAPAYRRIPPGILEDPDNRLSGALRVLLTGLRLEMHNLHRRIEESDKLIPRIERTADNYNTISFHNLVM